MCNQVTNDVTRVSEMMLIALRMTVNANVDSPLFVVHFYGQVAWMMIALMLLCGVSGGKPFDQIPGQVEGGK